MTAIINAIAAASLLAPNNKSLKNVVESSCKIMWDHVMLLYHMQGTFLKVHIFFVSQC